MAVGPRIAHFGRKGSVNLIGDGPGYAPFTMRWLVVVVLGALPLLACGGASSASGPCGPCAASANGGLGSAGTPRPAKIEQLARERVEVARKRLVQLRASFEHGTTTLDELFDACRDVAFAARDSGLHGETLRRILTEYRDAATSLRDLTRERLAKGAVNEAAMTRVESLVAEAEYWLAEASQGM